MRIRTMTAVLLQVASLAACDGATRANRSPVTRSDAAAGGANEAKQSADAIAVGAVGERERPASAPAPESEELWFRPTTADPMDRLILRTGQASIEVDSLETAMARLRQLARRAGGFVADAAVQSGRDQVRQATLELKVPSARFDELTEGLEPIGRLEFVNVSAEDVSEEFVVSPYGARDSDAFLAPRRRRADRFTRSGAVRAVDTNASTTRRRAVPARRVARTGWSSATEAEQAGDSLRRASPPLRPALRREGGEVQFFDQVNFSPCLDVHPGYVGTGVVRASANLKRLLPDGGPGVHRRFRRRLARVGRRPGQGGLVAAALDRP